jgi:hypothetical protein
MTGFPDLPSRSLIIFLAMHCGNCESHLHALNDFNTFVRSHDIDVNVMFKFESLDRITKISTFARSFGVDKDGEGVMAFPLFVAYEDGKPVGSIRGYPGNIARIIAFLIHIWGVDILPSTINPTIREAKTFAITFAYGGDDSIKLVPTAAQLKGDEEMEIGGGGRAMPGVVRTEDIFGGGRLSAMLGHLADGARQASTLATKPRSAARPAQAVSGGGRGAEDADAGAGAEETKSVGIDETKNVMISPPASSTTSVADERTMKEMIARLTADQLRLLSAIMEKNPDASFLNKTKSDILKVMGLTEDDGSIASYAFLLSQDKSQMLTVRMALNPKTQTRSVTTKLCKAARSVKGEKNIMEKLWRQCQSGSEHKDATAAMEKNLNRLRFSHETTTK